MATWIKILILISFTLGSFIAPNAIAQEETEQSEELADEESEIKKKKPKKKLKKKKRRKRRRKKRRRRRGPVFKKEGPHHEFAFTGYYSLANQINSEGSLNSLPVSIVADTGSAAGFGVEYLYNFSSFFAQVGFSYDLSRSYQKTTTDLDGTVSVDNNPDFKVNFYTIYTGFGFKFWKMYVSAGVNTGKSVYDIENIDRSFQLGYQVGLGYRMEAWVFEATYRINNFKEVGNGLDVEVDLAGPTIGVKYLIEL